MRQSKLIAKDLRKTLKAKYPDCKFSVTTRHGHEINVALMSAPETPFASLDMVGSHYDRYPQRHAGEYAQLNHYHIRQDHMGRWTSNCYHLTEQVAQMFQDITELGNVENYDKSDLQTDYHCVGYYFGIDIGKWDRPFAVS